MVFSPCQFSEKDRFNTIHMTRKDVEIDLEAGVDFQVFCRLAEAAIQKSERTYSINPCHLRIDIL
jgi:hypothetical protein